MFYRLAAVMDNAGVGIKDDFPSGLSEAPVPFDLFGADERDFDHRSDVANGFHANGDARAPQCINLDSAVMAPVPR